MWLCTHEEEEGKEGGRSGEISQKGTETSEDIYWLSECSAFPAIKNIAVDLKGRGTK